MPAWGPRIGLPRLLRWVEHYRAHRRLYPLWREQCEAVPDVLLIRPSPRLIDALAVRHLAFRLHRRVIELRDAQLALRPYLDPQVADTACELGRQAGVDGEELRAVVEAASLAAAVDAKTHRRPGSAPEEPAAASGGTDLGADLQSETAWLVKVATAYRSPLMRVVVPQQQPQPATAQQSGSPQGP